MIFWRYFLGALLCLFSTTVLAAGPSTGGGGDASEMSVDEVRADILNWIQNGGAKTLHFPSGMTYDFYVQNMTKILVPHAVVVSFVTTEQEQQTSDPEQKVIVDGDFKACRGFISTHDKLPHILCNTDRYPKGGTDQYRLIHHEYAGLAGVENNVGASSDYEISEQITEYLVPETVLRLSVKKANTQAQCFLLSSSMNINGGFDVDQVSPFVAVDLDTYYATTNVNHIFSATIKWQPSSDGEHGCVDAVFAGGSGFQIENQPLGGDTSQHFKACDGDGNFESIALADGIFWVDQVESKIEIKCNRDGQP